MQTINFDHDWRFHLGDVGGAQAVAFNDSGWRRLDVPHDWSIEGTFSEQNPAGAGGGALPGGVGWYRKTFTMWAPDSDRVAYIEFDGIYRNSEVWVNGTYLGKRPYGYSSFRYELTPHLQYHAPNVIAVRVDNSQQPNSRWYSGSGIPAGVRLLRVVDADRDDIGRMVLQVWGQLVTERAVPVGPLAEVGAVYPDLAIAIDAIELDVRHPVAVRRPHGEGLAVPSDTAGQRAAPGAGGILLAERAFNAPIVRHIQAAPAGVVEGNRLRAADIAEMKAPVVIEIDRLHLQEERAQGDHDLASEVEVAGENQQQHDCRADHLAPAPARA